MCNFGLKNILDLDTVALSFVFGNYYLIIELGSKDLSRKLQAKCIISYF